MKREGKRETRREAIGPGVQMTPVGAAWPAEAAGATAATFAKANIGVLNSASEKSIRGTKIELARENKPCTYWLINWGARKTAIADRTLPVTEGRWL